MQTETVTGADLKLGDLIVSSANLVYTVTGIEAIGVGYQLALQGKLPWGCFVRAAGQVQRIVEK